MNSKAKSNQKYWIEQGLKDIQDGNVVVMNPGGVKMTREQIAKALWI